MTAQLRTSSPLFDSDHLARYTGGDVALTQELTGLMCQQAERCLTLIEGQVDWREAAHTLKGAARGVGAFALAELCDPIESGDEAPDAALVAQLWTCLDATRAAIEAAQLR
ncbi:Hpt domain-containing protein [Maricaulis sp. CAU 1757]